MIMFMMNIMEQESKLVEKSNFKSTNIVFLSTQTVSTLVYENRSTINRYNPSLYLLR